MTSSSRVCAIVIHYGDPSPTIAATRRLEAVASLHNVVIVANDLLPEPEQLAGSRARWLTPPRNLGFAGACHYAVERFPADRYVFLNADVELDSSAIAQCLAALDLEGIGVVGPVLYRPNGSFQSACGTSTQLLYIPRPGRLPRLPLEDCDWVTGAALFTTSDAFRAAGMDSTYFLGYEDVDYCARVRRAGLRVVVRADAIGTHLTEATGTKPLWAYYYQRNAIWFLQRNGRPISAAVLTAIRILQLPRSILADILLPRDRCTVSRIFGLLHAWTMRSTKDTSYAAEPIPARWLPERSLPEPMVDALRRRPSA